jgi:hypothetical protein
MAMLSSPLAAMAPPPGPRSWGMSENLPLQSSKNSLGRASKFNFRDLSMSKSQPDYFCLKNAPVRGSSPTSSLAADLSQNFCIEQRYDDIAPIFLDQTTNKTCSPQLPTPRRSLFTSGLFAAVTRPGKISPICCQHRGLDTNLSFSEGATTPPIRWEGVTTPPIPSSSPAGAGDSMDISPLPHKIPFTLTQKAIIESPTRSSHAQANNIDDDMISPYDTFAKPNHLVEYGLPPLDFVGALLTGYQA